MTARPDTTIIAPVPEADAVIGSLRAAHDPAAALGVPAHITLLGPFLAPERVDARVRERLAAILAGRGPIAVSLRAVRRFPETLYLAPEPAEPFAELTRALWEAWPECPPYGGAYETVIPHLTIGHGMTEAEVARASAALLERLPIEATLERAELIAYDRAALLAIGAGGPRDGAPPAEVLARFAL